VCESGEGRGWNGRRVPLRQGANGGFRGRSGTADAYIEPRRRRAAPWLAAFMLPAGRQTGSLAGAAERQESRALPGEGVHGVGGWSDVLLKELARVDQSVKEERSCVALIELLFLAAGRAAWFALASP